MKIKTRKIPAGWRRLRNGILLRKGDRFFSEVVYKRWCGTNRVGYKTEGGLVYIRKIK